MYVVSVVWGSQPYMANYERLQALKVLQGDCDDHGVLLCCFFLRIGLKTWLALGSGIPHGRSSFVLTQQDEVMCIWDATTGQKYSLDDSFCPLHKIHCLINDENVWFNIQKDEALRRVKFDINRRADWWPMFGKGMSQSAIGSMQPAQLELFPTSQTDTRLLQERIEKVLRDSIKKWRTTTRTVWNRYCIVTLRKLLPTLEKLSRQCEHNSAILQEHLQQLSHILSSHKMCGFPLNFAYTRIEEIEEAVKGTGVHCYENPEAEFALAVYVHPYSCDILSVWVYIAYLTRRR